MPPNVLTDLIDAETRRRILEDNEDLVAPLPGIVVGRRIGEDLTPPRIEVGDQQGLGPAYPLRPPVATRPDLQPGQRPPPTPQPQPVVGTWDPTLQDMPEPQEPYPGQRDYTPPTPQPQPVPLRPDLQPGQRPPQPPAETPEQGFLGNVWEGVKSAFEAGTATGRPQWLENMDLEPGQPAISALPQYDVGDIQGFGEPPPSQFDPHPLEGLGVQDIFETGTLDMKQQLLEDIRDWEDVVYGGQRQNPYTGTLMRYYQDPRYEYASESQSKKDADAREFAAWEEDFGPFQLTTEKQLWWGEETGLLEWPEDLDLPDLGLTDYPEGYGGYGEGYGGYRYPSYGGGYGVPSGYSPYSPNRRQGYVGLVSWRI